MRKWVAGSLRVKILLVFLFFSIIPVVAAGVTNYVLTGLLLEDRTKNLSEQAINKLALFISSELQTLLDMTAYYSKEYSIVSILDKEPYTNEERNNINAVLKNQIVNDNYLMHQLNWVVNYLILTKTGDMYTSNTYLDNEKHARVIDSIKQEPWFDSLDQSYFRQLWLGRRQDYLTANLSNNIYAASNIVDTFENRGIFLTSISVQYFSRILDNSQLSSSSSLYLVDEVGQMIAESNNNHMPFERYTAAASSLSVPDGSMTSKVKLDSESYILVTQDLVLNGYDKHWKLISLSPLKDIGKDIRYAEYLVIVLVAGLLVSAILLGYLLNRMILQPVVRLNMLMTQVKKGNLNVFAKGKTTDELGQLNNGFNRMIGHIKDYIETVKREEREKRNLELEILQEQIKPHFIRNTLNTIRIMAQMRKAMGISNAIVSISKLIDYNFMDRKRLVTVQDEINYLKEYIHLQELRYQNNFSTQFDIEESLLELKILKLSFQPIVENSIMHGFAETKSQGKLYIKGYMDVTRIVFEISDDGIGIEEEQRVRLMTKHVIFENERRFGGIGLLNVDQRIKLNFGNVYGLSIWSEKGVGTKVTITFPILS